MKTNRRIEVTAFRNRVTVFENTARTNRDGPADIEIGIFDSGLHETIESNSAEGKKILAEVIRVLEEHCLKS